MIKYVKGILSLAVVVGMFWKMQEQFHFLDISWVSKSKEDTNVTKTEESKGESKDQNGNKREHDSEKQLSNYVQIRTKKGTIVKVNVDIADEKAEIIRGLSFRKYLGSYDGMLFLFKESVDSAFWMKDMNFPLDILFVDAEYKIVDIKNNNAPCTEKYCPQITSSSRYKYVLEVNANFCDSNSIEVGDTMTLHLDSEN